MGEKQIEKIEGFRVEPSDYFAALAAYDWLDGWFKTQSLTAELEDLKAERKLLAALPLKKSEILDGLKASYATYQERRQRIISGFLADYQGKGDVFKYVSDNVFPFKNQGHKLPPVLTWEEIEKALREIPEAEGAIFRKDQEKGLLKLNTRIGELEAAINELFPFQFHGKNHEDKRAVFVSHWANLQATANWPVNPEGWDLEKYGTPQEKAAWKALKLRDFINLKGLNPFDPEKK